MAKTSTVTLTVQVVGDGVQELPYVPPGSPVANTSTNFGGPIPQALAAGDNTIAVPAGATGVVISPPTNSANLKRLKGAGADTGVGIATAAPWYYGFAGNAPANIIINSVGVETFTLHWT